MTLEEFHQVICWWFRSPHRLKFEDGRVLPERWPGAAPDDYQAVVELAEILNRARARHPGAVLYLLTQREIDALVTEIGAGRVFLERSLGRGDGHSSDLRMSCDPTDTHYWHLQQLAEAYNVALGAHEEQTGRTRPQSAREAVEWLQMAGEILRAELGSQGEESSETGAAV
jgi:hypothetical protein